VSEPTAEETAPEPSFYDEIGGMSVIEGIVRRFYEGVATDRVLGPMYPAEDLADRSAERRLRMFLVQYWGGPTTYSQERGHPRLRMRHAPFIVNREAQAHWLALFRPALDGAGLTREQNTKFWGYITYAAEFMLNSDD